MPKYLIQDIIPPDRKHRKGSMHEKKDDLSGSQHRDKTQKTADEKQHRPHDTHPHHDAINANRSDSENIYEHEGVTIRKENFRSDDGMLTPDTHTGVAHDNLSSAPQTAAHTVSTRTEDGGKHVPDWARGTPLSWKHDNRLSVFNTPLYPYGEKNGYGSMKTWGWWAIGIIAATGAMLFLTSMFFNSTTVSIIPKKDKIPMDHKFTAAKLPVGEVLPYAIMTITENETREVPASGTKTISSKASGQIVVYNEQTVSQRLIKNTRFESPKGHIYRINDSITIPKAVSQNGKLIPGSLTVTVYADEPGPAYNSEPVDFTIPGLKGGPLYTKVYARSKGPITGGASGTAKVVRDDDLKTAEEDLRVAIETKLRNRARTEISAGQIVYDGGFVIEVGKATLATKTAEREEYAVTEASGRLAMVVFDRTKLTRAIARALLPTWKGEQIEISNLDALEMHMDRTTVEALEKGEEIEFTLKGVPEFRWVVDAEDIKKTLAGMPISRFDALMRAYPTIERATTSRNLLWNRSFPDDPEKINVIFADVPHAP